jgi:hypothetical protein
MKGNLRFPFIEKGHPRRATLVHVPLTVTETRAFWPDKIEGGNRCGSLPCETG